MQLNIPKSALIYYKTQRNNCNNIKHRTTTSTNACECFRHRQDWYDQELSIGKLPQLSTPDQYSQGLVSIGHGVASATPVFFFFIILFINLLYNFSHILIKTSFFYVNTCVYIYSYINMVLYYFYNLYMSLYFYSY